MKELEGSIRKNKNIHKQRIRKQTSCIINEQICATVTQTTEHPQSRHGQHGHAEG
jgi:hypothetical protein